MKKWREIMKYTKEQAAQALHLTVNHITKIERGAVELTFANRSLMFYLWECKLFSRKPGVWDK